MAVLLWRERELLLGRRLIADGVCWQFPGGRLEQGESLLDCAERELSEEAGLTIHDPVLLARTSRPFLVHDEYYVTRYVAGEYGFGEPVNKEPDKCLGWQWFTYDALPSPLFEPISILLQQLNDSGDDLFDLYDRIRSKTVSPSGEHR